jgi:hypothetical protein
MMAKTSQTAGPQRCSSSVASSLVAMNDQYSSIAGDALIRA